MKPSNSVKLIVSKHFQLHRIAPAYILANICCEFSIKITKNCVRHPFLMLTIAIDMMPTVTIDIQSVVFSERILSGCAERTVLVERSLCYFSAFHLDDN